ncbi:MAG: SAM-dependent chlorinase/fluorinase [Alphaproteobacteria bacterium]
MILLFTDFGYDGFYVGQMRTVLARGAPGVPIVDLMHDAPAFDPAASAYLLAALTPAFPPAAVIVAVVDPGVGGARRPIVVRADERLFVGPDNGLFELVLRNAAQVDCHAIECRPETMSNTFHGRDLFAPVAAALARGATYGGTPQPIAAQRFPDWPDDLPAVIYVDGFGNLVTGLRAKTLADDATLTVCGERPLRARTFGDVEPGALLWYANSVGLVEIAMNQGSASVALQATIGTVVTLG